MMTGIVILVYNNYIDTINCINSILKYSQTNTIKIIIVDNGSEDIIYKKLAYELNKQNTINIIDNSEIWNSNKSIKLSLISYIKNNNNIGYAQGNNIGGAIFGKDPSIDSIMILNNDTLFTNDLITPLYRALNTIKNASIVTPILLEKDGININNFTAKKKYRYNLFLLKYLFLGSQPFGLDFEKKYYIDVMKEKGSYVEIDVAWGACFMMRMKDWKMIGGFDNNTFLYFEEDILCEKIKRYGGKCFVIKDCSCIHIGGQTTSNLKIQSPLDCYYESMIYYFSKYEKVNIIKLTILKFLFKCFLFRIRHNGFKK